MPIPPAKILALCPPPKHFSWIRAWVKDDLRSNVKWCRSQDKEDYCLCILGKPCTIILIHGPLLYLPHSLGAAHLLTTYLGFHCTKNIGTYLYLHIGCFVISFPVLFSLLHELSQLHYLSDIDECAEGRDFCNELSEVCVNSEGNYWCSPILDGHDSGNTHISTTTSTTTLKPPPLPPLPPKPEQAAPQCPLGTEYDILLQTCVGK